MVTVLITTSGTGSRLGARTQYTNKSLVKIGDMNTISHILQYYPESTEFVITLGYYGSHVKQFLRMAYPRHTFQFVEVDLYEGPGSSLGYSMLKAKDYPLSVLPLP
jgi:NDP-sugar pyrophosphorylase family protein